jgi:hypothetical protein
MGTRSASLQERTVGSHPSVSEGRLATHAPGYGREGSSRSARGSWRPPGRPADTELVRTVADGTVQRVSGT